jgi:hypothetical protein
MVMNIPHKLRRLDVTDRIDDEQNFEEASAWMTGTLGLGKRIVAFSVGETIKNQ